MDILTIYLICLTLLISYLLYKNIVLLNQVKSITDMLLSLQNDSILPQLSSYEIEKMQKEYEFDERILRLKDELDYKSSIRHDEPAVELNPHVHNLPHSIIEEEFNVYPDEEEVAR